MVIIQRPNKDALVKGCDIYRDAMRPFLLRVLRRVKGSNLRNTIRRSLPPRQRDLFDANFSRNSEVAGAIDIGMFPHLIRANWRALFSDEFRGNNSVREQVGLISDARNKLAHPGTTDLDAEYTRARLSDIADVLGSINAPEEKKAIESIRDSRWSSLSPPQSAEHPRPSATSEARQGIVASCAGGHPNSQADDDTKHRLAELGTFQNYAIYVDDVTHSAKVHRIDKGCYKKKKRNLQPNNRWLDGPYTLEETDSVLCGLKNTDSRYCGNCMRQEIQSASE